MSDSSPINDSDINQSDNEQLEKEEEEEEYYEEEEEEDEEEDEDEEDEEDYNNPYFKMPLTDEDANNRESRGKSASSSQKVRFKETDRQKNSTQNIDGDETTITDNSNSRPISAIAPKVYQQDDIISDNNISSTPAFQSLEEVKQK
jgi:hypothetical protein